jgi:hypothetical protein
LFKRNLGGIGQSHLVQSFGLRVLWTGLARLAKVALLRSLQRSRALCFSRFFQRRQIESPVFIEWRLPMSLSGEKCVSSPRYSGVRVRVRGLFPAAVKQKHLVEFTVIHRK